MQFYFQNHVPLDEAKPTLAVAFQLVGLTCLYVAALMYSVAKAGPTAAQSEAVGLTFLALTAFSIWTIASGWIDAFGMTSPLPYFWLGVFGMSSLINMSLQTVSEPSHMVTAWARDRQFAPPDADAQQSRA